MSGREIMVTIKFHLNLIEYVGKQELMLTVKREETLESLLRSAGIPVDLVGLTTKNGSWCPLTSTVEPEDVFEVFPFMMGG
jgi:sulfur carrier protein ThiS